jgi:hypothetical protein
MSANVFIDLRRADRAYSSAGRSWACGGQTNPQTRSATAPKRR